MEVKVVPYEVAKMLKKAGFNKETFLFYNKNNKGEINLYKDNTTSVPLKFGTVKS